MIERSALGLVGTSRFRVYYEDVDLAGVVYYANYLKFLERGRSDLLRESGVDQAALKADSGHVFVVARLEIDYRRPARFDDMIEVSTRIVRAGGARVDMAQSIARVETDDAIGPILVDAAVRVAVVDGLGRAARLPTAARIALENARDA